MTSTIENRNRAAAKHFDDTAKGWTDRYLESCDLSHQFLVRRQAVTSQLDRITAQNCDRALDLGCGTGPYLPLLARRAREVTGVDVAPAMIEEARRNLPDEIDNVRLIAASVFDLPFDDNYFDVGVCVGVLEYFDNPVEVLRAAFRVIKPGGSIIFTVPSAFGISRITGLPRTVTLLASPSWKLKIGSVLDRARGREPDPSKYYLGAAFTAVRLRRLCEEAGLEVVHLTTSGYDGLKVMALPVPARLDSAVDRYGEANRHRVPWKGLGNNLIATIRKRARI